MRKGSIAVPILAMVFALLAAAGVAYFGFINPPKTNSNTANTNTTVTTNTNTTVTVNTNEDRTIVTNENVNVATNSSTNTSTDPTADWKTYANSTLGYSVKYPSLWKTSNCQDMSQTAFGLQGLKCDTDAATEDFIIDKEDINFNLEQRITEVSQYLVAPVRSTVAVDGVSATLITGTQRKDSNIFYGGGVYTSQVYIPKDGSYYRIAYSIVSGEKKYASEFTKFLSTFTFTN